MTEKRKKIISVILSAVLCFTLLGAVGINAEDIFEQPEEQPAEEIVEVVEEVPEVIVEEPVEKIPAEELPEEEPAEEEEILEEEQPVEELPEEAGETENLPEEELTESEEIPDEELPEEEEDLEAEEAEEEELIEEEPEEEQEVALTPADLDYIKNQIDPYFSSTEDIFRDVVAQALFDFQEGTTETDFVGGSDADIKASLAKYTGDINAKNMGISSIEGIQYLTGVTEFDFDDNNIEDLRPLETGKHTYSYVKFTIYGNPIHKLPHAGTDAYEAKDVAYYNNGSASIGMNKSGWFSDEASYIYDGLVPKQNIYYDVIMEDNDWRGNTKNPAVRTGNVHSFEDKGNYAQVEVNSDGEYRIGAETSYWREISAYDDGNNAEPNRNGYTYDYHYRIVNTFFGYVDNGVEPTVLGGVKFTKNDSAGNPVNGATYGLFVKSEGKLVAAKDHNGNTVPQKVTGSEPGSAGVITWGNLDAGTYYVKEITPPVGYLIDNNEHEVTVSTDTGFLTEETAPVTGGEGSSVTVNAGTTTWTPDWTTWNNTQNGSSHGWGSLRITSGETSTVSAASKNADVFIKNGGNQITLGSGSVDTSKVSAVGASGIKVKVGSSETSFESLSAAQDYINGFINPVNTENNLDGTHYFFEVSGQSVFQLNTDYYSEPVDAITDASAPIYLKPSAFKTLVGNLLTENQFMFNLSGKDSIDDIDETEGNDVYGNVNFDTVLEFDAPGTFNFILKEVIPDTKDSRITYDENEREIKVVVTESGDSRGLMAVITVDEEDFGTVYSSEMPEELENLEETRLCEFENYCTQPLYILPTCYKILSGRTLKGGEFGFTLTGKDSVNEINLTAYNDVNGRVKFSNNPLKFDKAGFYFFKISEIVPDTKEANMTYDENVYTLSVTVEENEETHTLSAVVKVNGTQVGDVIVAEDTTQRNGQVIENIGETKLCTFHNIYAAESRHNPVTGVKG